MAFVIDRHRADPQATDASGYRGAMLMPHFLRVLGVFLIAGAIPLAIAGLDEIRPLRTDGVIVAVYLGSAVSALISGAVLIGFAILIETSLKIDQTLTKVYETVCGPEQSAPIGKAVGGPAQAASITEPRHPETGKERLYRGYRVRRDADGSLLVETANGMLRFGSKRELDAYLA